MNIGVVGANGFIGKNICSYYTESNIVYAFVNKNYNQIPSKCILITSLDNFNTKLDYLFISIGNYNSSIEDYLAQTKYINNLLQKFTSTKIIFISSTAVYGNHDSYIELNSSYNNPNLYGSIKLLQENLIKLYSKNYCIIRPTYVYGKEIPNTSLIPTWIKSSIKFNNITIYGDGSRTQDYIHISDLINICNNALSFDGIILAASGIEISNFELANIISQYIPNTKISFQGIDNTPSCKFKITNSFITKDFKTEIQSLIDYEISNMQ